MTLIRDNDDERRARVEALICELLRPRDQESPESALPTRAPREHTAERTPAVSAAVARR